MPWSDFSSTVRLLAMLGKIKPEIFDVFPPHGMLDRLEPVVRNPQLPSADPLISGAIVMSGRLVQLAVESDARGEDSASWLAQIIEDWCGTPWPRKWPWPGPGPSPVEGPRPEPWAVNEARAVGAVVLASTASKLGDGPLRTAMAEGANRLAEVAASVQ